MKWDFFCFFLAQVFLFNGVWFDAISMELRNLLGKMEGICWGLNSDWFLVVGDGYQPNSVESYMTITRIPYIKGGMTIPNVRSLDPGTY